ncbi:hypothetical protein KIPB_012920, partial [Kipferlia bialata]
VDVYVANNGSFAAIGSEDDAPDSK